MTRFDGSASPVSDRGLRVFAAAARAGSLSLAADQLGTGQPAISHAVRRLETAIGKPLLERSRTGVTTTPAGQALLVAIEPAYDSIDSAVELARGTGGTPPISLLVSTSLATWWLLPRLPEFKRRHPDVPLRLVTTDTDIGVSPSGFDLWIPLGLVDMAGTTTTPLCAETVVPVCTPELAAELGLGDVFDPGGSTVDARTLLAAPLLHLEERYSPRYDWRRWFADNGIEPSGQLAGDTSTDYSLVLHAALDGQGIALGWVHLVGDLIDDGRLIALSEPTTTDEPFVIVTDDRRRSSEGARALRTWLIESMNRTPAVRLGQ